MMDQLVSREGLRNILMNDGKIVTVPDISFPSFPNLNATNRDPGTTTDSTSIMLRTTSSGAKTHETLAGQSNSGTYDGESHQHKSVPVIG
jgi:hypothetical protein